MSAAACHLFDSSPRTLKNRACVHYSADLLLVIRIKRRMATVLYHCPNTGFRVQGCTVDETIAPR
jgi:hypothetical protein